MTRLLLSAAVLLAALAIAPTADAQTLTTLYSSINGDRTVSGIDSHPVGPSSLGTFRIATAFKATASGDAQLVSVRARCVVPYPAGTSCVGIGEVSIQADNAGKPSGVSLGTMGFYVTDSLSGQPVKKECGTLSPRAKLTAGTKYWAVMSSTDEIGWDDWTNATGDVLESIDGGAWKTAFSTKVPALRIDSGFDECVPVAKINPDPGTKLGDMVVKTGGTAFNTLTLGNTGVAPLTLSGVDFSGPDAKVFSFAKQGAASLRFPEQIGVGATDLLQVNCTGAAEDRWYYATVTLHTNDPNNKDFSFPLECLVDNNGPDISMKVGDPDGKAGWYVHPIDAAVSASDASGMVTDTHCSRGAQHWDNFSGSSLSVSVKEEGAASLVCSATDVAKNTTTKDMGTFKLDTRARLVTPVYSPTPTSDGWNNTPASVSFQCGDDPTPGSGNDAPVGGGGTVSTETAGTDFTSTGCTDVAGNSQPATATVRIDLTKPAVQASLTPAPNAAGWNRTDVTAAFDCGDQGKVQSGIKVDTVGDEIVSAETAGTTVSSKGTCQDKATNRAAAASQVVKIDKTNPATTIDSGPPVATSKATADIGFTGDDNGSGLAGFECRLDGGAWKSCATGERFGDLSDGSHTVDVRAIDAAGNVDPTPASRTWFVDATAPETKIDSGPDAVTQSRAAAFKYSADDLTPIWRYECRLDDAAWGDCHDYTDLAVGEHRFEVRAVDKLFNVDATPATYTWTIDLAAPTTKITGKPAARTLDTDATFAFTADDSGGSSVAGFECRLDDAPFAPCTSEAHYTKLDDGRHTFRVRAVDAVGNVESDPASLSWEIAHLFANDDSATTAEDTPVTIDVGANDVTSGPLTITAGGTSEAGGTVSAAGDESLRYVPPAGFSGTDRFTYTAARDGHTASAVVTITVEAGEHVGQPSTPAPAPTPAPAVGAKPELPAVGDFVSAPSTRRCVSRRYFRIRVKHPGGTRVTRAVVRIDGRVVTVRRGARVYIPIDLRGLPKGSFTVEIRITTNDGRILTDTRHYRTCTPGPGKRPPRP
jgi:hypothetical protein